jgi:Trypsin-like peptidase domain/N-6 DNA Methylase
VTSAIGRLQSGKNLTLGTVFAIPGRMALTAFHCVGDRVSGKLRTRRVRCAWPVSGAVSNATVIETDVANDVALLRLESDLPPGLDPVYLARDAVEHSPFDAHGYPAAMPSVTPFTVSGQITSVQPKLQGMPALQLSCPESAGGFSLRGMSGSPILSGQPQRVVGILRWNQPREDRQELSAGPTAYATPTAVVLDRWPQLQASQSAVPADLKRIVRSLAQRRKGRKATEIREYVWHLLLQGGVGLEEDDLEADLALHAGYCHIVVPRGSALIEVTTDLRPPDAVVAAELRLDQYLERQAANTGARHLGIVTDGVEWRLYHKVRGALRLAEPIFKVDAAKPAADDLIAWLEGTLATAHEIKPTPTEISRKLGSKSPSYAVALAELKDIYDRCRHMSSVKVKREMWAKLLTTASGTQFPAGDDTLFVNHTLLVVMAEVIGHAALSLSPDAESIDAKKIVSGTRLSELGIAGVVERDFFDWVADVPEGARFIEDLARRLARFDWNQVEHDVMKALYHSIIDEDVRRRLGEYYTPDWLAEAVVAHCVTDPLNQHVLDPSCGSGTFLFHAIRHFLNAAEACDRMSRSELISELVKHVSGFDVHPVAVTLARVTYLLAIGVEKLKERTEFTVPVYLCDSLRWGQQDDLFSHKGLSVRTTLEHEDLLYDPEFTGDTVFSERLKFPDAVLADAGNFDRLVRELAAKATDRDKRQRDTLPTTFRTHRVPEDCRAMIRQSFENMCRLHDDERDHIWGYYVRNLARPVWMARPDNRADVLVGNPPWLSYKGMTKIQKRSFVEMCKARKIWAGASLTPTNNLAALFVARCIELYLKPEGRFGFVMPGGTLKLQHYERFRTGQYSSDAEQVTVAFDIPWDLSQIKPFFFRQSVGAVFGHRTTAAAARRGMGVKREKWSGYFTDTKTARLTDASQHISRQIVDEPPAGQMSPYASRFFQGAAVLPQILFLVQDDPTGPIGAGAGRRAVRTYRTPDMHPPWNSIRPLHDVVEEQFIKYLYLGSTLLPFRLLAPKEAVIPWDDRLIDDESLGLYPNLHRWWRKAEDAWREKRGDTGISLLKQLNYNRKLSRQFPVPAYRVVYPKSGIHCAAAIVTNETYEKAVIDQQLYWGPADTLDEARYLSAVLNAPTVTSQVQKMQPRGKDSPRDIAKYVFRLPIPTYDPNDAGHHELVMLAARAEEVASAIDLPPISFKAQRRRIRNVLEQDGVTAQIDSIVRMFLE